MGKFEIILCAVLALLVAAGGWALYHFEYSIRFLGEFPVWLGVGLAVFLSVGAWFLYWFETRKRLGRLRWILPTLRALAVFLIVMALTGPILYHEKVIRELGRLFVFVDGSESMKIVDDEMSDGRKAAAMQAAGYIPRSKAFEQAEEASAHLARAQLVATRAVKAGVADENIPEAVEAFGEHLEEALDSLEDFQGNSVKFGQPGKGFVLTEVYSSNDGRGLFDVNRRRGGNLPKALRANYADKFEFPRTTEGGFVVWMRGYLHAPEDGEYQFWLASDDQGELWMSTSDDPRGSRRLSNVNGYSDLREWDREDNQRSNTVQLEKGKRYFIEALLVAGGTIDHLSVGWRWPGSRAIDVIDGQFLSPVPMDQSGDGEDAKDELKKLRTKLLARVDRLDGGKGDPFKIIDEMRLLSDEVILLQERLTEAVRTSSLAYVEKNRNDPEFKKAIEKFDGATRLERMRNLLLNEDTGILRTIAKQQDIELIAMTNREVETMWWQRRAGKKKSGTFPNEFSFGEKGFMTDLGSTIDGALEGEEEGVGVIVLTDGQHNAPGAPVSYSKIFGERGIPMFTVGYGNEAAPMDMALIDVSAPQTVFAKDKISGELELRDSMRPGIPYRVTIEHEGEVVWEEMIESNNTMQRTLDYEFPVQDIVDKMAAASSGGIETRALALQFNASVNPVGAKIDEAGDPLEKITENNSKRMFVQAVTHPKKVLIIDSRPRWETRYVNSMFERDEQWESNLLNEIFDPERPQQSWDRGDEPGMFPSSREELFTYEVILFGDVPRRLFREDELEWLAEFVGSRAGGLVFIDGQRNFLTEYKNTELGKLLPVDRGAGDEELDEKDMPEYLRLTAKGLGMNELRFASSGAENNEIWGRLRPPAWTAPVKALPGSETLMTATNGRDRKVPVLVARRYGAGSVVYLGTDELWRWRYNVGDRYHQKFWVQMTNWVAEQPFSVQGKHVSIAADKMVYDPGGRAALRVRIRDDEGRSLTDGDFVALLYREGDLYSEVELEADPNQGGIFRARTGKLDGGNYEIAVKQKYVIKKDREYDARAEFVVRSGDNRELDNLSVNRELLETVAHNSGGQYFAEEEARNLVNLLESIDKKKVISSETNLWSSYWWFSAIIGLLVVEWVLRKRAGYI